MAVSGLIAITEVRFDGVDCAVEHQGYDPISFSWTVRVQTECQGGCNSRLLLMFERGWHLSYPGPPDALQFRGKLLGKTRI